MEIGPVDVLIIAFGEPNFNGSVLEELRRLAAEGTIRLLDAMVIAKGDDGAVETLDIEDLPAEAARALGFVETGTHGLFDSGDADTLIEGMVPGSAVAALAIEHTWAIGLRRTLEEVGGEVALTFRVPAPMMEEALSELGVE